MTRRSSKGNYTNTCVTKCVDSAKILPERRIHRGVGCEFRWIEFPQHTGRQVEGTERVARLPGAAEALCEGSGFHIVHAHRLEFEQAVAAAHAHLDDGAWNRAWAEGSTMPLEQAVAYALEEPQDA